MPEVTVTRRCSGCGLRRPLADFYSGRKNLRCRYCARAYTIARTSRLIAYAQKVKLEAGCMDCGLMSPYPEVYDFDHRPGVTKQNDVSRLYMGSMRDLVAEILKCDVVCSNCHRIRTFDRKKALGSDGTFGVDKPRRPPLPPVDLDPMLDFG
jgi:hypothetical protein